MSQVSGSSLSGIRSKAKPLVIAGVGAAGALGLTLFFGRVMRSSFKPFLAPSLLVGALTGTGIYWWKARDTQSATSGESTTTVEATQHVSQQALGSGPQIQEAGPNNSSTTTNTPGSTATDGETTDPYHLLDGVWNTHTKNKRLSGRTEAERMQALRGLTAQAANNDRESITVREARTLLRDHLSEADNHGDLSALLHTEEGPQLVKIIIQDVPTRDPLFGRLVEEVQGSGAIANYYFLQKINALKTFSNEEVGALIGGVRADNPVINFLVEEAKTKPKVAAYVLAHVNESVDLSGEQKTSIIERIFADKPWTVFQQVWKLVGCDRKGLQSFFARTLLAEAETGDASASEVLKACTAAQKVLLLEENLEFWKGQFSLKECFDKALSLRISCNNDVRKLYRTYCKLVHLHVKCDSVLSPFFTDLPKASDDEKVVQRLRFCLLRVGYSDGSRFFVEPKLSRRDHIALPVIVKKFFDQDATFNTQGVSQLRSATAKDVYSYAKSGEGHKVLIESLMQATDRWKLLTSATPLLSWGRFHNSPYTAFAEEFLGKEVHSQGNPDNNVILQNACQLTLQLACFARSGFGERKDAKTKIKQFIEKSQLSPEQVMDITVRVLNRWGAKDYKPWLDCRSKNPLRNAKGVVSLIRKHLQSDKHEQFTQKLLKVLPKAVVFDMLPQAEAFPIVQQMEPWDQIYACASGKLTDRQVREVVDRLRKAFQGDSNTTEHLPGIGFNDEHAISLPSEVWANVQGLSKWEINDVVRFQRVCKAFGQIFWLATPSRLLTLPKMDEKKRDRLYRVASLILTKEQISELVEQLTKRETCPQWLAALNQKLKTPTTLSEVDIRVMLKKKENTRLGQVTQLLRLCRDNKELLQSVLKVASSESTPKTKRLLEQLGRLVITSDHFSLVIKYMVEGWQNIDQQEKKQFKTSQVNEFALFSERSDLAAYTCSPLISAAHSCCSAEKFKEFMSTLSQRPELATFWLQRIGGNLGLKDDVKDYHYAGLQEILGQWAQSDSTSKHALNLLFYFANDKTTRKVVLQEDWKEFGALVSLWAGWIASDKKEAKDQEFLDKFLRVVSWMPASVVQDIPQQTWTKLAEMHKDRVPFYLMRCLPRVAGQLSDTQSVKKLGELFFEILYQRREKIEEILADKNSADPKQYRHPDHTVWMAIARGLGGCEANAIAFIEGINAKTTSLKSNGGDSQAVHSCIGKIKVQFAPDTLWGDIRRANTTLRGYDYPDTSGLNKALEKISFVSLEPPTSAAQARKEGKDPK